MTEPRVPLPGGILAAVGELQVAVDGRITFRLAIIVSAVLLADDRRTTSARFVAACVQDDWNHLYCTLIGAGRTSSKPATVVLGLIVRKLAPGYRITLAMDGSPTSRTGKQSKAPACITIRRLARVCSSRTDVRPTATEDAQSLAKCCTINFSPLCKSTQTHQNEKPSFNHSLHSPADHLRNCPETES